MEIFHKGDHIGITMWGETMPFLIFDWQRLFSATTHMYNISIDQFSESQRQYWQYTSIAPVDS